MMKKRIIPIILSAIFVLSCSMPAVAAEDSDTIKEGLSVSAKYSAIYGSGEQEYTITIGYEEDDDENTAIVYDSLTVEMPDEFSLSDIDFGEWHDASGDEFETLDITYKDKDDEDKSVTIDLKDKEYKDIIEDLPETFTIKTDDGFAYIGATDTDNSAGDALILTGEMDAAYNDNADDTIDLTVSVTDTNDKDTKEKAETKRDYLSVEGPEIKSSKSHSSHDEGIDVVIDELSGESNRPYNDYPFGDTFATISVSIDKTANVSLDEQIGTFYGAKCESNLSGNEPTKEFKIYVNAIKNTSSYKEAKFKQNGEIFIHITPDTDEAVTYTVTVAVEDIVYTDCYGKEHEKKIDPISTTISFSAAEKEDDGNTGGNTSGNTGGTTSGTTGNTGGTSSSTTGSTTGGTTNTGTTNTPDTDTGSTNTLSNTGTGSDDKVDTSKINGTVEPVDTDDTEDSAVDLSKLNLKAVKGTATGGNGLKLATNTASNIAYNTPSDTSSNVMDEEVSTEALISAVEDALEAGDITQEEAEELIAEILEDDEEEEAIDLMATDIDSDPFVEDISGLTYDNDGFSSDGSTPIYKRPALWIAICAAVAVILAIYFVMRGGRQKSVNERLTNAASLREGGESSDEDVE